MVPAGAARAARLEPSVVVARGTRAQAALPPINGTPPSAQVPSGRATDGSVPPAGTALTAHVQRAQRAGEALPAALQVPDERQRRAQQALEVLAAAQQHGAGVRVQVLHCGPNAAVSARAAPPSPRGPAPLPVKDTQQQPSP